MLTIETTPQNTTKPLEMLEYDVMSCGENRKIDPPIKVIISENINQKDVKPCLCLSVLFSVVCGDALTLTPHFWQN
jgi:hypothetical protein